MQKSNGRRIEGALATLAVGFEQVHGAEAHLRNYPNRNARSVPYALKVGLRVRFRELRLLSELVRLRRASPAPLDVAPNPSGASVPPVHHGAEPLPFSASVNSNCSSGIVWHM